MATIEVRNLTKVYRVGFWKKQENAALKGISFEVNDGEVFGCLGANGAGKTTTLKILMGFVYPTSGEARIAGRPVDDLDVKRRIGFLPEQPYFYEYLTAAELLNYYGALSGVPSEKRTRRIKEMLDLVGLSKSGDVQLRKYSKGMQQRVGIAQALVHDPDIVFLDEPMSGLDPIGRHEVRELIQSLKDAGKTVFFSTHILSDAEALCDRVAVLHLGELKGIEVVADLMARARGKVEITWQAHSVIEAIQKMSLEYRSTGESARAIIADHDTNAAIDALRRAGARLVSVNPVHGSLEEHFLKYIGRQQTAEHTQ